MIAQMRVQNQFMLHRGESSEGGSVILRVKEHASHKQDRLSGSAFIFNF